MMYFQPQECTVLSLSQKMVVRGCCHCCCHSHVLFFSLAPCHCWLIRLVLCHLEIHQISLFSRHGLDKEERNIGWGMIKEGPHSPHTNRLTGRQSDGGGRAKDRILGEKEVKLMPFRLLGLCDWICICLLLVYVYSIAAAQRHIKAFSSARDCVPVFVYEHMLCVCVCLYACPNLS